MDFQCESENVAQGILKRIRETVWWTVDIGQRFWIDLNSVQTVDCEITVSIEKFNSIMRVLWVYYLWRRMGNGTDDEIAKKTFNWVILTIDWWLSRLTMDWLLWRMKMGVAAKPFCLARWMLRNIGSCGWRDWSCLGN